MVNSKDIVARAGAQTILELDENKDGAVSLSEVDWGRRLIMDQLKVCESKCAPLASQFLVIDEIKANIEKNGPLQYFKGFERFGEYKADIKFSELSADRQKQIVMQDHVRGNGDGILSLREAIEHSNKIQDKEESELLAKIENGSYEMRVRETKEGVKFFEMMIDNGNGLEPALALTLDLEPMVCYLEFTSSRADFKSLLEQEGIVEIKEKGKPVSYKGIDGAKLTHFEVFSRIKLAAAAKDDSDYRAQRTTECEKKE